MVKSQAEGLHMLFALHIPLYQTHESSFPLSKASTIQNYTKHPKQAIGRPCADHPPCMLEPQSVVRTHLAMN